MAIDDQDGFTANGPAPIGFLCHGGADILWGGRMEGTDVGLYSQARDPGPISGSPLDGNVPPKSPSSAHRVTGRVSWARPMDRSASSGS